MDISRFILSEKPDALDGALEWLDAEIEQEEENDRLSRQVEDHIRPLVLEIAKNDGLVVAK
jgi:cell division protein FtsL